MELQKLETRDKDYQSVRALVAGGGEVNEGG